VPDFSAKESGLGYLFQVRYALWLILEGPEERETVLESLDDITLESEGLASELLQTKHHSVPASLTNASAELWKTPRIWSSHLSTGTVSLPRTALSLVTTAIAPSGSIASMLRREGGRNTATALEELRLHEAAFQQIGGVPEEILYDRMKTVWLGTDERGEIVWHPVFLDFARYWGFTPRLCRPYRAQTKGKVESGVKYVRRNFLCGLQGREPGSLNDLNAQLREWIWGVANQRVHGTTHERVMVRWDVEQFSLQSLAGQPPYPYVDGELRKVARDAYVDWQGSRYSVPWEYAGQEVWVQEIAGEVDIRTGRERIAMHGKAQRKHSVLTFPPHHQGIPLGARRAEGKILIHLRQSAPEVEKRSLAAYERVANGGGR
jgi:hypothetical protein